jgi:hypothetical protein
MKPFAWLAIVVFLACASGPIPVAQEPIDWNATDDRWSLHIVTLDPDESERVTRIWLALVDGDGTLRTGDSRWWANLKRDPNARIRVLEIDYPLQVEFVTEHEQKARIDDAFVEKYGWIERMMFPQDRGETHDNYAVFRPVQTR